MDLELQVCSDTRGYDHARNQIDRKRLNDDQGEVPNFLEALLSLQVPILIKQVLDHLSLFPRFHGGHPWNPEPISMINYAQGDNATVPRSL